MSQAKCNQFLRIQVNKCLYNWKWAASAKDMKLIGRTYNVEGDGLKLIIGVKNNYQNYLMSNIRDLQKLKGNKNGYPLSQIHQRLLNPEINNLNYQPLSTPLPIQHRIIKNNQYNRQPLKLTPTKANHKRGGSFGTQEIPERHTFNLIQNPRLSVYNFPLKIEAHHQDADDMHPERHQMAKTQRKIKNNYVFCKDQLSLKKHTIFYQPNQDQYAQISKNNFSLMYPVGKGGFGKVWKVEMKKTKQIFAMKEMSKAKVITKKSVTSVMNQRNFLAKLYHPFLVNMTYAFQDRDNLYLAMDYLDGGDLRYHLGNRQFFNQKQTKFFLANIIISLQYLHRHKIIHRDLKPENLVFDSQGYLKLTDLGISRELREDNHQDTSGTPGYMAPEVMVRRPHSYTADYYALGVIAYELMLGKRPYQGANRKQIKQQILARQVSVKVDQLPFKWSPYSIDFVNKMILRNPDQRLGANGIDQIKEHPWLSDIEWEKIINRKIRPPFKPISIQQDYENYKEQISEDTINDNEEEIFLMLRKSQIQQLFQGYHFEKTATSTASKKSTSFPTNSTEETHGRK